MSDLAINLETELRHLIDRHAQTLELSPADAVLALIMTLGGVGARSHSVSAEKAWAQLISIESEQLFKAVFTQERAAMELETECSCPRCVAVCAARKATN